MTSSDFTVCCNLGVLLVMFVCVCVFAILLCVSKKIFDIFILTW